MNDAENRRASAGSRDANDDVERQPADIDVVEIAARMDADATGSAGADTGEDPAGETTEALRNDIEQTRAQMSGTIDEIQERLSPTRLMNDAKETVRDATVGKVTGMMNSAGTSAAGIVDRVKENPMSAAMIGLGTWWLLTKLPHRRTSSPYSSYGRRYGNYGNYAESGGIRDEQFGWSSQGGGDARDMREVANDATEAISDYATRGQQRVGEITERTERQFNRWMRENPLAVGAAAIAVGAAIGLAIPETQRERALVGETRDRLMDKAQEMASQKVEQVASNLPGGGGGRQTGGQS